MLFGDLKNTIQKTWNKSQKLQAAAIVLSIILIYVAVDYFRLYYIKQQPMVTRDELENCQLYIQNSTCPTFEYKRSVEEPELVEQVMELCVKHKRFRSTSYDGHALLGHLPPINVAIFENQNYRYTFSFYSADGERTIENIHEALPIITINKSAAIKKEKYTTYDRESAWYCYLPQEDYVKLFELITSYEGGELE